MHECWICRHTEGSHDVGCPLVEGLSERVRQTRMASYRLGYRSGREGSHNPSDWWGKGTSDAAAWKIGHIRGTVALEEVENGEPPEY